MTHPDPKTPACLYARVSTELQEEQQTIKSQVAELETAIATRGDVLVRSYLDDGYSGELLDRPALNKLRDDARSGLWTRVYILSPDRLARKHHIAGLVIEELRTANIDIVFLNHPLGKTIEDDLLFNLQAMFAEYEKAKILERQRRGKLFKARKALVVGGKAPYGYTYVRNRETREGKYILNDVEAETVRLIYDLYSAGGGRGFRAVVRELHARGIPTRMKKRVWNQVSINHILSDETYIGTTYYNKRRRVPTKLPPRIGIKQKRMVNTGRVYRDKSEWIPIAVPPIVSRDQFDRVQDVKRQNTVFSRRNTKAFYLLKNLVICGRCDSAFYATRSKNYSFYFCSKPRKTFPNPPDHRRYVSRDFIDNAVWKTLCEVLEDPVVLAARINELSGSRATAGADATANVKRVEAKLTDLERQRERLVSAYSIGAISADELTKHTSELHSTKQRLLALRHQHEEQAAEAVRPITIEEAQQISRRTVEQLRAADFDAKQRVVRSLVRNVTVYDDRAVILAEIPRRPGPAELNSIAFASLIRPERNPIFRFECEIPLVYSSPLRNLARDDRGRFLPQNGH